MNKATLICTDARFIPLPDNYVHCVVTSPPYWGLRNYDVPSSIWGGDPECEHNWTVTNPANYRKSDTHPGKLQSPATHNRQNLMSQYCLKCGAWLGCLGLEPSPDRYVENLVTIMREVKRVLRNDGVCFFNIGDSYIGSGGAHKKYHANVGVSDSWKRNGVPHYGDIGMPERYGPVNNIKPLNLAGIPWRLAFALQADGWFLRSDIIWAKKSCLPESVNGWRWERCKQKVSPSKRANTTDYLFVSQEVPQGNHDKGYLDGSAQWESCSGCKKCEKNEGWILRKGAWRPTRSHEYLFMLTKTEDYFCDREAAKEPKSDSSFIRYRYKKYGEDNKGKTGKYSSQPQDFSESEKTQTGRNKRDVWHVGTESYKGEHYAVFPKKLVEPCIKAATSEFGVCSVCGEQYAPILDYQANYTKRENIHVPNTLTATKVDSTGWKEPKADVLGYRAICDCNASVVPAVVLDPFSGAATTGVVAGQLKRDFVGVEIKPEYIEISKKRIEQYFDSVIVENADGAALDETPTEVVAQPSVNNR